MKKIIVISTDGYSREDGNVHYSRYLLVESDTLLFDEAIFTDMRTGIAGDGADEKMDAVPDLLRELGYTVYSDIKSEIIVVGDQSCSSVHDVIGALMAARP